MRALTLTICLAVGVAAAIIGVLASTARKGFSARTAPGAAETWITTSVRDWSIPARDKQMKNPADCGDAVLGQARAHWADHCATCHANNGSGETMLGRGMYPKPPDMRATGTQRQSDGALYYTIKSGVRLTGMPAFGEPGDADLDSWKLVCFIRHLPAMSPEEERQMRALNPKTPDEIQEELEEDQFLNGVSPAEPNQHHHH